MGSPVIVVGAGPVGLTLALALAGRSVPVRLVEKRASLSSASKASTFHPPTLAILASLGVWEPNAGAGQLVTRIRFLDLGRDEAGDLDLSLLSSETPHPYRLHLEQAEITPRLLERLRESPHAQVTFSAEAESLEQRGDGVVLRLASGERIEGSFLVGADGAHSRIRSLLGIPFEGEDYGTSVLRLRTRRKLDREIPGIAPLTYLFRDSRSCSLLKMSDCWRIILRIPAEVPRDLALSPEWWQPILDRILPLARLDDGVADLFSVSRRVAASYVSGRTLLIGDAAHVTNTRGGMNMNCGIHDAWEAAPALAAAWRGEDGDRLVEMAKSRRDIAVSKLIPRTDRSVSSAAWLDEALARAADPDLALSYLRSACMLDMVAAPGPTYAEPTLP